MKIKRMLAVVIILASFLLLTFAIASAAQDPDDQLTGRSLAQDFELSGSKSPSEYIRSNIERAGDISFTDYITVTANYLPAIFKKPVPCSTIPTLIYPSNEQILDTIIPEFTWNLGNGPDATLSRMQIAKDSDFSQIRWDMWGGSVSGIEVLRIWNNLEPATIYYWRAWLMCGDTQGPYSAVWSFTTGSDGVLLPAPDLIAPPNGSSVLAPTVNLQWSSVPGAVDYLLRWKKIGGYGSMVAWVEGTQHDVYVEDNSTYEWSVIARNDYALGVESVRWQFNTIGASDFALPQNGHPNFFAFEGGIRTGLFEDWIK